MWDILNTTSLLEIALLTIPIYLVLRFLQGTRGLGVLRGFVLLLVAAFVILSFVTGQFERINYLLGQLVAVASIAVVVIFQPELRRGLVRLGQRPFLGRILTGEASLVHELVDAARTLSRNQIGALIALQREVGLAFLIEGGTHMDSRVTAKLLTAVFWPGSPLHDGAVIIRNQRIAAAGCLLPLSDSPDIPLRLGTRHRAAVGLSEESDAVCVIVSEETGHISVALSGSIREDIAPDELGAILEELLTEKANLHE